MSRVEELTAISIEADQEMERQNNILSGLRLEVERTGDVLDCRAYSDLRARIEMQQSRVERVSRLAREKQAALDEARSKENAKLQRELAQREYDSKLNALNAARAEIMSKRSELTRIQNDLPLIEQRQNILLFELDRAKSALQQSEVCV